MGKVVSSNRALAAMVSGIERFPDTENGGVLLGIEKEDRIYVVEAIEAGAESVREKGRLSFESSSIEHTLQVIMGLYEEELSIIGVWHKHNNECNPPFSTEDDICHKTLSCQLQKDIVSILFQKRENDEYMMRVFCYKSGKLSEEEFEIAGLEKIINYRSFL